MEGHKAPLVVGLVSGSHVINHSYLLLFAPAFAPIRADLGVSLAAVGGVLGVVNLAITAGQLPFGYVSDAYSHTGVLVGSLALGTVGCLLAAVAPTYEWLLVAAAVMGLGVAGHHPAHYPLISAAAGDAYRSRAYSVHGFAGAIGLGVPFAVVPASVALGGGWRGGFLAMAALGGAYTATTAVLVRRVPASVAKAGARANRGGADRPAATDAAEWLERAAGRVGRYGRTLVATPLVPLLTALWFANSVAVWGVRSYAATLLDVGYGLDPGAASAVASAMFVVGAFVLLGGGYLADRIGPMSMLFVGYGSLVVLGVAASSEVLPFVIAVGVVLTLAATIDVSRPARATLTDLASERSDVGKNFALITIGVSIAGTVAPPVFGYVIEATRVGVAFLGIAATAAVALALSVAVGRANARVGAGGEPEPETERSEAG
ncbi:MFS transporter [Natronomonas sp.]|uniref:MFS transporter n=1 Tax=Natronomonas sp. TaxID=2184060 RepID=UPI00263694E6|nr:MFS transporter [Natronomonas sp.]